MTLLLAGVALDLIPTAFAQGNPQHDPNKDFPVPFEAQQSPLFYFKRETFQPYVGGIFKVSAGAKTVEMKLERVRGCAPTTQALKVTKKSRTSDCFALEFSSAGALTDLTTIYDVEHAALGKFALFMTRRDGPGGKYEYEAVFNHAQ
ncbi:MAG TPA: hypothetical protein VGP08_15970 [Pyrinomonadaceae bacterium]|jgi:hypothetical protein|nr:hypothetical protein [Pyrinomonadaceae bacterium]